MKPQRDFHADLHTLGITQEELTAVINSIPENDPCVWDKRTQAFHEKIKSGRKQQLRKWHPDVCKDPLAVEKAAEINAAADGLLTLAIGPKPVPMVQMIPIVFGFGSWTDASAAPETSTVFTGSWFSWRTTW